MLKRVIFLAMFSSVPLAFISLVKEVPSKGAPGLGQPSLKSACISSLRFSYVWVGADMPGVAIPPGGWWSSRQGQFVLLAIFLIFATQCCLWQDLARGRVRWSRWGPPNVGGGLISGMEVEMGGICPLFLAHCLGHLVSSLGIGFVLTLPDPPVLRLSKLQYSPFLGHQLAGGALWTFHSP